MTFANDSTAAADTSPLVVEDDRLERAYDAQFVPLYQAARAVRKRFTYVKKLCLCNKVTHRRAGPKNHQRFTVHLTELRRVIREHEIYRPGHGAATQVQTARDAAATNLHPAVLRMLDPKPPRPGRRAG